MESPHVSYYVNNSNFLPVRFRILRIINTCRWYFDFQLPSEVLVKKSAKFDSKFADCKNLHRYCFISA